MALALARAGLGLRFVNIQASIPKIAERGCAIDEQLSSSPHWSYTLLKVGTKGCRHLRKLLHKKKDLDNSQWPHLTNGMEFLNQLKVQFLPYKAEKVIASIYRNSTVPLAWDMQILLLRNNLYARKLLYNMKILHNPYCHLCPQKKECRTHRLWSCPHSEKIWKFINEILVETMDSPIYIEEVILGEYEEKAASHRKITILSNK